MSNIIYFDENKRLAQQPKCSFCNTPQSLCKNKRLMASPAEMQNDKHICEECLDKCKALLKVE